MHAIEMSQFHAKTSAFSSKTVTQRRTQPYDSDASDATEITPSERALWTDGLIFD